MYTIEKKSTRPMIYRDFKGNKLSMLSMGNMRLPVVDGKDSVIDEPKAIEMIEYAYNNGINYFDTAWGYHGGNSEIVVDKALSKFPRENYYLADKFPGYDLNNMDKVEEIFEKQLEKCQTPYFDFYLIHNVCESNIEGYMNPEHRIVEYLLEQKKNGRIKYLGFSAHGRLDTMEKFMDYCGEHMEFCQLQINYMDWHFQEAEQKVEMMRKAGIPIWIMEPVRGGSLINVSEELEAGLKEINPEITVVEWANRFLQNVPDAKVVLTGASTLEQLKENIEIWNEENPLSQEEFDRLIELSDRISGKIGVPCTACSYCVSHCPQGLPIPKLIANYNEHKSTVNGFIAPMAIAGLPKSQRPSSCIACGNCEKVCPQAIRIAEVMKEFNDMLHA